jgi:hypothetical protein
VKRWTCPACGGGALAPERPRADDVRAICLDCSKRSGRLVRRTCPALAKTRAAREVAQREAKRTARARKISRVVAHWTVAGLDVFAVASKCWAALGGMSSKSLPIGGGSAIPPRPRSLPSIALRRSATKTYSTGRAYYRRYHVALTFGTAADAAKVWELVLHELAHHRLGPGYAHDEIFNRVMSAGAIRLWGLGMPIKRGYGPTRWLEAKLRAQFASDPAATKAPAAILQEPEKRAS